MFSPQPATSFRARRIGHTLSSNFLILTIELEVFRSLKKGSRRDSVALGCGNGSPYYAPSYDPVIEVFAALSSDYGLPWTCLLYTSPSPRD